MCGGMMKSFRFLFGIFIIMFSLNYAAGTSATIGAGSGNSSNSNNNTVPPDPGCEFYDSSKSEEYEVKRSNNWVVKNKDIPGGFIMEICDPSSAGGMSPANGGQLKGNNNQAGSMSPNCDQQYEALKSKCDEEVKGAATSCDQDNETMKEASTVINVVGAGSLASLKLACSKIGKISMIANGALATWQGACGVAQGSCSTSCSQALDYLKDNNSLGCILEPSTKMQYRTEQLSIVKSNHRICEGYKQRIADAAKSSLAAIAQAQTAKKMCDDVNDGKELDECKKNPKSPLCVDTQKCSNPDYAASNVVCKCLANPTAKECQTLSSNSTSKPNTSSGLPNGGSGANGAGGGVTIPDKGLNENSNPSPFGGNGGPNQVSLPDLGGQKGNAGIGGGAGAGSGANGNGGPKGLNMGSGAADAKDNTKINSGYYGGGGSMNSGFYGGGSGNQNNYGSNSGPGRQPSSPASKPFNPSKYLVGLDGKSRTPVNSSTIDIFKIVSERIDGKKPTLLDPQFRIKK